MTVELIKTGARIYDGLRIHANKILCDHCSQSCEFHCSSGEEHRVEEWFPKAKAAVNRSHTNNYPDSLAVPY